jgi:hypothetical protein
MTRAMIRAVGKAPLPLEYLPRPGQGRWLGEIEAQTAEEAIKIASERFGQPKERLIAVRLG